MEAELNKALDILVMFFTNVNTIDDDNLVKLAAHLHAAGRSDLVEALTNDGMAAGLRDYYR